MNMKMEDYKKEVADLEDSTLYQIRAVCYYLLKDEYVTLEYANNEELLSMFALATILSLDVEKLVLERMTKQWDIFDKQPSDIKEAKNFTYNRENLKNLIEAIEAITGETLETTYKDVDRTEGFWFDGELSVAHFQGKECKTIPKGSYEYYVLLALSEKKLEEPMTETDLQDFCDHAVPDRSGNESRIYDAHNRINKKVKEDLGVDEIIGYKGSTFWRTK